MQGTNLAACIESRQVAAVEALSQPWLADVLAAKGPLQQLTSCHQQISTKDQK